MNAITDIVSEIDYRVNAMIIDVARLQDDLDVDVPGRVKHEHTEQADSRREYLRVEKFAIRDRELEVKSRRTLYDSMLGYVHDEVSRRIDDELQDIETIYRKVLGASEYLPDVLDILHVRAASIGRIEPVIAAIPWLANDLIKMVNMPKYRKQDRRGKTIAVETLRMALSFIGLDNLKLIIPTMVLRRWLPQITDPYPSIKGRLWDLSMGSAISCRKLAELVGQDAGQGFTIGMFHNIGHIVLVRLYFRLFETVQQEAIKEAQNSQRKTEYDGLINLKPCDMFLGNLLEQQGLVTSAHLLQHMDMRRLYIAKPMMQVAEKMPLADRSPLAKILSQGMAYGRYRCLQAYRVINVDEAKDYLRQFALPKGALAELKKTNLKKLDLTFSSEQ